MSERTVYVMAYLVTKLELTVIAAGLSKLLSGPCVAFSIGRKGCEQSLWRAQGFEVRLIGLVTRTDKRLDVLADGAQAFADDPGNVGIDLQLCEVPSFDAMVFWAQFPHDATAACRTLSRRFPWDTTHGPQAAPAAVGDA